MNTLLPIKSQDFKDDFMIVQLIIILENNMPKTNVEPKCSTQLLPYIAQFRHMHAHHLASMLSLVMMH